jgi:hypothetical protein
MTRQISPGRPQTGGRGGTHLGVPSTASNPEPTLAAGFGEEYAVLSEFALEANGTELLRLYKSPEGIRTPSVEYEQGLLSIGSIVRAIGPGSEPYSVGQLQIEEYNTDRQYSILKNGYRFRGRKRYIKFGRIADGLNAARQLFVGSLEDWSINSSARVNFSYKDAGIDRFKRPLRETLGTVRSAVFPDLPAGRPEVLINLIYGDVSTNGGNMIGAGPIPCQLIDPDVGGKWRYLACGAVMKSVDTTFVYGDSSHGITTTVTTDTYDGRDMTVIDFDSDPRDPARPNEIEVTILGKGITDDGTTGGNLITNPVEQLKHFLVNYAGWTLGELDTDLFDAAIAAADANLLNGVAAPYVGSFLIGGDVNRRVIDVLNEMTRSFLLYIWMTTENRVGTFILTLNEAQNPGAPAVAVSNAEIVRGSFKVYGNRDVYSAIEYQRVFNWTLGKYAASTVGASGSVDVARVYPAPHISRTFPLPHDARTFPLDYDDAGVSTLDLGDDDTPDAPSRLVSLEYVADEDTAISVATVYSLLASEFVQFVEFDLPPEYLLDEGADLNRYIAITHWQGISGTGGYVNAVFRIVRTEASLMPKQKKLRCTGIRLAA